MRPHWQTALVIPVVMFGLYLGHDVIPKWAAGLVTAGLAFVVLVVADVIVITRRRRLHAPRRDRRRSR